VAVAVGDENKVPSRFHSMGVYSKCIDLPQIQNAPRLRVFFKQVPCPRKRKIHQTGTVIAIITSLSQCQQRKCQPPIERMNDETVGGGSDTEERERRA